jgi:ABC-type transport system involved in multi-copper enzyme maturation permease subunit
LLAKGKPFLEIFALSLNEDYRFPILELFVFFFALGTFVLAGFGAQFAETGEAAIFNLANSLMGFPMFIFIILMLKNIAFGLGSDIEKGIIQTLLCYPLKRKWILTAKLLSALGVAIVVFLGLQIFAISLLAPDMVALYPVTVALTYAANLVDLFFVAGLVLLLTLVLRRGGLAIVGGIVLFFAITILESIVTVLSSAFDSALPLQMFSVISPSLALQMHHQPTLGVISIGAWSPNFSEILFYIGAGYVLVIFLFLVGYIYFDRRLEI